MFNSLKQLREHLKMSQVEVAKNVGVSLGAYRLWEAGVGKPNAVNMEKIVSVLGKQARNFLS
jgi:DNA-binding transcriptional regulator YiaG